MTFTVSGDDICRLKAEVRGTGWEIRLFNELAAPSPGSNVSIPVFVRNSPGCSRKAVITLSATSESDNGRLSETITRVSL